MRNGFFACASSFSSDEPFSRESYSSTSSGGIVPNHAYAILDAISVDGYQLVKVSNPWNEFVWNGDWGPSSHLWTGRLRYLFLSMSFSFSIFPKRLLSPRSCIHVSRLYISLSHFCRFREIVRPSFDTDPGVFYMSFEDFCLKYSNIVIALTGNWKVRREKTLFRRSIENGSFTVNPSDSFVLTVRCQIFFAIGC